jgi:hypothetical protein
MKIPEIKTDDIMISDVKIRELNIPPVRTIFDGTAPIVPAAPPVVLEVGLPVVDVPGCVEAHEKSDTNENLLEDDPKGTKTFCDGDVPNFNPIQYEPERIVPTREAPVPKTESPDKPALKVPKTPEVKKPPVNTLQVECPTKVQKAQEPVGTFVEGFKKKVVGYELIDKTCVQITEPVPIPKQIVAGLPSGGQVVQVGSVAAIATTSALLAKPLADLLLRVVKPTIKKVIKKIAAILGKKNPTLSVRDRRDQQRLYSHALRKLKGKE